MDELLLAYIKYLNNLEPKHREAWEQFHGFRINPDGSIGNTLTEEDKKRFLDKSGEEHIGRGIENL